MADTPNMKIVFVTSQFPVSSETFVVYQAVTAIQLGYNVSILTSKKLALADSSMKEVLIENGIMDLTYELEELRPKHKWLFHFRAISYIHKVPLKFYRTFNPFEFGMEGLRGELFYGLTKFRNFLEADIFHVQFGTNSYPLPLLKKYKLIGGRLITTFHGIDAHFTADSFEKRKASYAKLFSIGDWFTTNTQYLANQLLTLGCPEPKIKIIPMCVDTNYFVPSTAIEQKTEIRLITVGRLIKLKGQEWGIRAVKILRDKGYNVRYNIVGDGDEFDHLSALVNSLDLDEYVHLTGKQNQDQIRDLLQQSQIYLMTSTYDHLGRRETQGVVTAEAQSCGLPVCAFRSGGVPFTIEEDKTGFLSSENDYEEMASKIERLIINPKLLQEFSNNAVQLARSKFSLRVLSKNLTSLYQ